MRTVSTVMVGDTTCNSLWKAARKSRQARSRGGHTAMAHPTKKITRGRLRAAYRRGHGHWLRHFRDACVYGIKHMGWDEEKVVAMMRKFVLREGVLAKLQRSALR